MRKNHILTIFGSLLYPIYMLPFILSSVLNNYKIGYILLSFFIACLGFLMIPYDTMDIVRHYEMFTNLKNIPFENIVDYGRNVDYIFSVYSWMIINLGFPKEFIPFTITLFTYSLYFLSFYHILNYYYNEKSSLRLKILIVTGLVLLLSQIRFMDAANGLRNASAFSLFTYAFCLHITNKKSFIAFNILAILSIAIHASAIFLYLTLLLSKIFKKESDLRILVIIALIILALGSSDIFYRVIELLEPTLRSYNLYYPSYFDPEGSWGAAYFETANLNTLIFEKYLKPLPYYITGLYFLFVKKYNNQNLAKFLMLLFFIIACLSVSRTIFDRLNNLFVIVFILFLTIELNTKKLSLFKKIFVILLFFSTISMSLGSIYKYRDIFWRSWHNMLFIPMPILFLTNEILEEQYIIRNSGE